MLRTEHLLRFSSLAADLDQGSRISLSNVPPTNSRAYSRTNAGPPRSNSLSNPGLADSDDPEKDKGTQAAGFFSSMANSQLMNLSKKKHCKSRRAQAKLLSAKIGSNWLTSFSCQANNDRLSDPIFNDPNASWEVVSGLTQLSRFLVVNIGFYLIGIDVAKPGEAWFSLNFVKSFPTCHDINQLTLSQTNMDIIIGFSQGDILWINPFSGRYLRFHKQAQITAERITQIKWIPHSDSLIAAAFADGKMAIIDVETEEITLNFKSEYTLAAEFLIEHPPNNFIHVFEASRSKKKQNPVACLQLLPPCPSKPSSHATLGEQSDFFFNSTITDFQFSPDGHFLAVSCSAGSLYILRLEMSSLKFHVHTVYLSSYGGFLCVAWTPDGKYVAAGGQDDIVILYSVNERRPVVRCEGHESWVRSLVLDFVVGSETSSMVQEKPLVNTEPTSNAGILQQIRRLTFSRRQADRYCLTSVGEDCRLCQWEIDFTNQSIESPVSAIRRTSLLQSLGKSSAQHHNRLVIPASNKAELAVLPQMFTQVIHSIPIAGLVRDAAGFVSVTRGGEIRIWKSEGLPATE